jgi:threonine 3-dehydrogenase
VAPVITHKFHYTEHKTAFDTTRAGRCGKVLLDWTEK